MTRSLKEPPEQPSPVDLRGGGSRESGVEGNEITVDDQPMTLATNIAQAFLSGANKRAELRRQLGMDDEAGEATARSLNFKGEEEATARGADGTTTMTIPQIRAICELMKEDHRPQIIALMLSDRILVVSNATKKILEVTMRERSFPATKIKMAWEPRLHLCLLTHTIQVKHL
jgi:hypothetical protein